VRELDCPADEDEQNLMATIGLAAVFASSALLWVRASATNQQLFVLKIRPR
jgi:hypothetical protein